MKGIIDTATDFVAVEGNDCASCTGLGYTPGTSTTVSNRTEDVDYGAYQFSGSWAQDSYCVDFFTCLDNDIDFFLIEEVTNDKPLSDAV